MNPNIPIIEPPTQSIENENKKTLIPKKKIKIIDPSNLPTLCVRQQRAFQADEEKF
jgi:hypothetical protein